MLDYAAQFILALQCLLAKKRNASVQLAIPILQNYLFPSNQTLKDEDSTFKLVISLKLILQILEQSVHILK